MMASINLITTKLKEMEGGLFQRLCDDWLHRQGYKNINSTGMMDATNRVKKGTPDSLFILENGRYACAEYSVQNDRLFSKLQNDVLKCLDEEKTGIPNEQIDEIIICYLGKLSAREIESLKQICRSRDIQLIPYGLDAIAHSIQNTYPILATEYLDMDLDTGQILSIDDFVARYNRNKLTTSIDNDILFQDELMDESTSLLESNQLLLISGQSGTGKTLFAVHLLRKIQEKENDLKIFCLFDKGLDLYSDITAYLSEPGEYLIFIDDANRLDNRINYLLHYLHDPSPTRNIRILATVRDYARQPLVERLKQYTNVQERVINNLTNDQIKELLEKRFGITNSDYQVRIQEIVNGNARLAVMAVKIAIETNQLASIRNVASLYDEYFGQADNVKNIIDDYQVMMVAAIVAFFRVVDRANERQMQYVQKSFGFQEEKFWELVHILHKNELVDLYENEVVKISDQILSTYLFYIAVFQKQLISFSVILNDFYPSMRKNIMDALNPTLRDFDHKKVLDDIRPHIVNKLSLLKADNQKHTLDFLNTFWFILPTEALVFANSMISQIPNNEIDWKNESFNKTNQHVSKTGIFELLVHFRFFGSEEFKMSFDLLLNYLEKDKEVLPILIKEFSESYNFKYSDYEYSYYAQDHIINTLIDKMDNGKSYLFSMLFIAVSNEFLKLKYEDSFSHQNTVYFRRFSLPVDNIIENLRAKIIKNLSTLLPNSRYQDAVIALFKNYMKYITYDKGGLCRADFVSIKEYLIPFLNHHDIYQSLIVKDYLQRITSLGLDYPNNWNEKFSSDEIGLFKTISNDRFTKLKMTNEEYKDYQYQLLLDYFSNFTIKQFSNFLDKCVRLHQALSGREESSLLTNGIERSFKILLEVMLDDLSECILIYQKYDDILEIHPYSIVDKLLLVLGKNKAWEIINANNYKKQKTWRLTYFILLTKEDIGQNDVDGLLNLIESLSVCEMNFGLSFLDKYVIVDSHIHKKVINILLSKSQENRLYAQPLRSLFFTNLEFFGKWHDYLTIDHQTVCNMYLSIFSIEEHFDYDGKILQLLIQEDFTFLFQVLDEVYAKDINIDLHTRMPKLDFLWDRSSYLEEIESIGKYLTDKEKDLFIYDSLFSKLFIDDHEQPNVEQYGDKQLEFFKFTIEHNAHDMNYMYFLFQSLQLIDDASKKNLIELFVKNNQSLHDYKTITNISRSKSWSGSRVPILEQEKKVFQDLLPIFNTIELLEHRSYVESLIEDIKLSIVCEKKRDFMDDR